MSTGLAAFAMRMSPVGLVPPWDCDGTADRLVELLATILKTVPRPDPTRPRQFGVIRMPSYQPTGEAKSRKVNSPSGKVRILPDGTFWMTCWRVIPGV